MEKLNCADSCNIKNQIGKILPLKLLQTFLIWVNHWPWPLTHGVNPVLYQSTHMRTPLDWSQTSAGPSSLVNNCGLPCTMDTPARDSKYIQLVCLKSSGMKIIYLHLKSTPYSITFSSIVCVFLTLCAFHIYISGTYLILSRATLK